MLSLASVVYSERVWLSHWVSAIFILLIGSLSAVTVAQEVFGMVLGNGPAPAEGLVGLDALFVVLFANFHSLKVEIGPDSLEGLLWHRQEGGPHKRDRVVQTHGSGVLDVRRGGDDSLAFTTSMGRAIEVVRKGGRSFVFSTRRPADVAKLVNSPIPSG